MTRYETIMEQKLTEIAEAAARDISGDNPDAPVDYDIYIEQLGRYGVFGLIDMGESYQGTFDWQNGQWVITNHDPVELKDSILRKRGAR